MKIPVLFCCFVFTLAYFTSAVTTTHETDLVVKDRALSPNPIADSSWIIPEHSLTSPLPKPLPPLLNECAACAEGDRQWYYNVNSLKRAAYVCGFDYLLLRFDRSFKQGPFEAFASFFFHTVNDTACALDSDRRAEAKVCLPYGSGNFVPTTAQSLSTMGPGARFASDSSCFFVCKSSGCDHNQVSIRGWETVEGRDKLFRVDVLFYSANQRQTVAAGSVWAGL